MFLHNGMRINVQQNYSGSTPNSQFNVFDLSKSKYLINVLKYNNIIILIQCIEYKNITILNQCIQYKKISKYLICSYVLLLVSKSH